MAVLLAAVGLVVGLWIARNYAHTGRFIFVASYAEGVLLAGNSPLASAARGEHRYECHQSRGQSLDEAQRRRYYRQEVWRWLTEHPRQAIRLYFSKVLYWSSPTNRLAQADQQTAARDLTMILTYCPLLLLFVIRLFRFRRTRCNRGKSCAICCTCKPPCVMRSSSHGFVTASPTITSSSA